MTDTGQIPDEVKWRIAADFAARLPALYEQAFRSVVGERYDEIEQEVWMELSRTAFTIAHNLALPVGDARELADSLRVVMNILFGPEFRGETLEVSKDGAVILVKRCPFLSQEYDSGSSGEQVFHRCMAFVLMSTPGLNKKYSARYVRTMCTGDRQCEIKIAEGEPETAGAKKKK